MLVPFQNNLGQDKGCHVLAGFGILYLHSTRRLDYPRHILKGHVAAAELYHTAGGWHIFSAEWYPA
jgi:hypothetical protein